jgi:16S rRNA (uracil1498-N3)-methyltransferase
MPRFFCPTPLSTGLALELPPGAARHVQVLRLQPGDTITLFNYGPGWTPAAGADVTGGEFEATITRMGRSDVAVEVASHTAVEREAPRQVHLAVGMPANDRMDWLVEKATELGVASIQPLMSERSVLRLSGDRADKKIAHWQSVAVAACEQCGGNRVPTVWTLQTLTQWLKSGPAIGGPGTQKLLLSLADGSKELRHTTAEPVPVLFLSGPEGGLSSQEEDAALQAGFAPVSLGARVLRAETAALAALAALVLGS